MNALDKDRYSLMTNFILYNIVIIRSDRVHLKNVRISSRINRRLRKQNRQQRLAELSHKRQVSSHYKNTTQDPIISNEPQSSNSNRGCCGG